MRPIVDGLQTEFGDRVAFSYVEADDGAAGLAAFQVLGLRGHPGFVVFAADGREVYRGLGLVEVEALRGAIESALGG